MLLRLCDEVDFIDWGGNKKPKEEKDEMVPVADDDGFPFEQDF
jgi:hypothetical protein